MISEKIILEAENESLTARLKSVREVLRTEATAEEKIRKIIEIVYGND